MTKECLICGSPINKRDIRKKYCDIECQNIANSYAKFIKKAKDGRITFVAEPQKLAKQYLYATAKVHVIERIMKEKDWNVPESEKISQDHTHPDLDELDLEEKS